MASTLPVVLVQCAPKKHVLTKKYLLQKKQVLTKNMCSQKSFELCHGEVDDGKWANSQLPPITIPLNIKPSPANHGVGHLNPVHETKYYL